MQKTAETLTSFFREEEGLERPQTKMVKKQFPISFTERCSHWLQPKYLKRTDMQKMVDSQTRRCDRKLEAPERVGWNFCVATVSHEVAGCAHKQTKLTNHFNSFGLIPGRFYNHYCSDLERIRLN